MELISQHTKQIMEECKLRARDAGLRFEDETLEYIVTNRDLIRLSPKNMIPTLYDYWVNDVEVLREEGRYRLYPGNPYETVINSRPAISFYNDNNPDWLNVMIFYHVLAHIDFFQNNVFFSHTSSDDFVGRALADKRLIESLRSEHGRWVDYVIEFSRSLDNITGFYRQLPPPEMLKKSGLSPRLSFYFDYFLQEMASVAVSEIYRETDRYNKLVSANNPVAEQQFFTEVRARYPEFESRFEAYSKPQSETSDLPGFILKYSPFLKKDGNRWMSSVLSIVRETALYFAPQIRTKIMNEGWASYWHDRLFMKDERIRGFETSYARINAGVTSVSRIGLNPYAIGMRLFEYVEDMAEKGKTDINYARLSGRDERESYDSRAGKGKEMIFGLRRDFSDFTFIRTFVDQDFVDRYQLFTVGKRNNPVRGTVEYYIKSKQAEDYRQMLLDSLYHPPHIRVDVSQTGEKTLFLEHIFEGKSLYQPYIPDTLLGASFLWGGDVILETYEKSSGSGRQEGAQSWKKVRFTASGKKVIKTYV